MSTSLKRLLVCVVLVLSGCSHDLVLKNKDDFYSNPVVLEKEVTLGMMPVSGAANERHVNSIIEQLRFSGMRVVYPYSPASPRPVDYIAQVDVSPHYKGAGTNFLVSFPGFLIFAPAWNGYRYVADIDTKVTLINPQTREIISSNTYNVQYKCNQSEFDRTWTQGCDWLLTIGVASLIGGIVYTQYDTDITDEFQRSYSGSYGSYIARKVSQSIQVQ